MCGIGDSWFVLLLVCLLTNSQPSILGLKFKAKIKDGTVETRLEKKLTGKAA